MKTILAIDAMKNESVRPKKVLIACEFSGVVRRAFATRGHDAWSCDLRESEEPGQHIRGDVAEVLRRDWDLLIAHPPCTHLAVSGARWFPLKRADGRQKAAIDFFFKFVDETAHIPQVAIENPISIMSSIYRRPDQIIQPWQFGHGETKATCLWLKGLPKLTPTNIVSGRENRIHNMPPSPEREREREVGRIRGLRKPWRNNGAASAHVDFTANSGSTRDDH